MTTTLPDHNVSKIQIDYARMILERCQEIFSVAPPKKWASSGIAEDVTMLRELTVKTLENLSAPTLRLAFAGATSSGKSTLVNALIGRTLMPMEAGEMSAGVVQIFHEDRDDILLNIETPQASDTSNIPNDLWQEVTDFTTKEEEKVYAKLKEVMLCYHQNKKTSKIIAPNIQIRCRTLLGQQTDLLQLPPGVSLEIIDLPGIREVDDAANLKIVQNVLKKTVLIVVLGYEHTSEKQIQPLLTEVGEMINLFGNSSNLFFVLNKVDRWEQGDMQISDRIKLLKDQISPMLKNKENNEGEITIATVSAIQLYQYQTGLGFPLSNNLSDQQLELLATGIKKRTLQYDFGDDWYDLIGLVANKVAAPYEKLCKSGDEMSQDEKELLQVKLENSLSNFREKILNEDADLTKKRQLLNKAWEESEGQSLINSLAERVRTQLPRLVIQPAVYEFQIEAKNTLATIRGECATALTKTNEALNSLIKNLETTQTALSKKLETVKNEFEKDMRKFIELLTSGNSSDYQKARDLVKTSNYLKSLEGIFNILERIKQEATDKIFKTVQDYLSEQSQSVKNLQQKLQQAGCAAKEAGEFCNKIEELPEIFQDIPDGEIRIKREYCDVSMQQKMDQIRKTINEASSTVTPLLGSFFQKSLQGSVDQFVSMMSLLSERVRNELYCIIEEECQIDQSIIDGLIPTDDYIAAHVSISFDANSLEIPNRVEKAKDETETRIKYRNRTWGEWWSGIPTKQIEVQYEVDCIVLNFGTRDQLIENWDSSISTSVEGMTAGISTWFEKNIGGTLDFLEQNIETTIKRYQEICHRRITTKEKETTAITEEWTIFQTQWEQLDPKNGLLSELNDIIETGSISQQ
jgi:GTPase SAR1 family protein